MENCCLPTDSSTKARINFVHCKKLIHTALVLASVFFATATQAATLQPYRAIYTTSYKGMTAEAEQILQPVTTTQPATQPTTATQFVLSRNIKTMFVKIAENSEFSIGDLGLVSSRYTYKRGGLASKKNIEQLFQWQRNNLQVTENSKVRQVAIKPPLFDKLNYIEALRWQLLNSKTLPVNLSVALADRHHLKQYDFVLKGSEEIDSLLGKIKTVRLERHVPEDNKHTVIWVAPRMDYMLVKLQQTDDGDRFELHLKTYQQSENPQKQ